MAAVEIRAIVAVVMVAGLGRGVLITRLVALVARMTGHDPQGVSKFGI